LLYFIHTHQFHDDNQLIDLDFYVKVPYASEIKQLLILLSFYYMKPNLFLYFAVKLKLLEVEY